MPCPYCNEVRFVPDYVICNIDSYGPKVVRFACKKCNKVVKAYGIRQTVIENVRKTDEESDW